MALTQKVKPEITFYIEPLENTSSPNNATGHQPLVDVVVLNYNGKKFLTDCFDSVLQSTYPNFKLWLLDNSSTEDDVAWTKANYPQVNIIQNPLNNGFCAAYNLAISKTNGKYFLCLNNDVKVRKDWLEPLVNAAEADPTIGSLQCKMISFFDETQYEYAGASGGLLDSYGYPFLRGRVFQHVEADHGQYEDEAEVFWTCGAAMFIRRSVLEETGDFEDAIVHHMDEIDLCWRMHIGGYKCKIIPSSVILHYGGATIQPLSFKKMYWNHRNSLFMVMKNYSLGNAITKTLIHLILDYMAALNSAIQGKFIHSRAIFAAHWWILTHINLIKNRRKEVQKRRKLPDSAVLRKMYPKSVALQYFLFGKKTYTELINVIK